MGCWAPLASADACTSSGRADAKELAINSGDTQTLEGLSVSFQLGLEPNKFPKEAIARILKPCSRGTINVGTSIFSVFGENEDSPPRWATSATTPDVIVYFALTPRPDAALAWAKKYETDKGTPIEFESNQSMFVVALAKGDMRFIVAYFDEIPDDKRVKDAMLGALSGKLKLSAGYDVKTNTTNPGQNP